MKKFKCTIVFGIILVLILLGALLFFKPSAVIQDTENSKIYLFDYYQNIEQTGTGITFTQSNSRLDTKALLQYLSTCKKYRVPLLSNWKPPLKNGDFEIVFHTEGRVAYLNLGSQNSLYFYGDVFTYQIIAPEKAYQDILEIVQDQIAIYKSASPNLSSRENKTAPDCPL